jgi:RsiW-degrading membrane proteinase PrsW (M82 family)
VLDYLILLLPVALPVAFWVAYYLHMDRHLPEPKGHLVLAFALGGVSFYLGLLLYRLLGVFGLRYDAFALASESLPGLLAYAVLAIGVIEEVVKLIPFVLVILRFAKFDEPLDGIVYASMIALGFAAVENVLYVPQLSSAAAYARGFVGPVVHMAFASVWGYYVGRAWLRRRAVVPTVIASLTVTALLHGLYDFVVIGFPEVGLPFAALVVVGLWVRRLFVIRDLHASYGAQRSVD